MSLELSLENIGDTDAPVVIILHGLFGSSSNWRSISRELSDTYRVTSLDSRNHGKSPWDNDMTYWDLASDVAHYIESNGIRKPNIIGHSMGGKTAMTLLQEFAVTLGKMFVIDIAPVKYFHDHDVYIRAMQSVQFEDIQSRKQVDDHLALSIFDAPVRQFLMQNLVREGNRYSWRINLDSIVTNMSNLMDYPQNKAAVDEVVFIAGGQSTYILPDHHSAINRQFPNAVIETIPSAGHWLHAEKPHALLEILRKHLAR